MDTSLAIERTYDAKAEPLTYRPDIDGLRAVAVSAVIANHVGFAMGGFAGVDLFFVISGYLISGIIFRELIGHHFSLAEFYGRRVRRIFPALAVVLFTTWGLGWLILLPDEYREMGANMSWSAGFLQDFFVYKLITEHAVFENLHARSLLGHLWSLGVEEQFYLLWPVVIVTVWKFKNGVLAGICALITASLPLSILVELWSPMAAYFLPWNRLWELALGGLLAYYRLGRSGVLNALRASTVERLSPRARLVVRQTSAVAGAVLIIQSIMGFYLPLLSWGGAVPPSVGALLLISAGPASWINRSILSARPMTFLGKISYPLYLWHVPLLRTPHIVELNSTLGTGLTSAVLITIALILAYLTYKYIESPIRGSQQRTLVVASLLTVMATLGLLGYMTSSRLIAARSDSRAIDELVQATEEDWLLSTPHSSWTPATDEPVTLGNSSKRTLFMGDNSMQQYYPRVLRLVSDTTKHHNSATFATREWCPPVAIETITGLSRKLRSRCETTVHDALEYATRPDVDTIVIAAHWSFYFTYFHKGTADKAVSLKPNAAPALEELGELMKHFVRAGKRVYVVLDNPGGIPIGPHQLIHRTAFPLEFSVVTAPIERSTVELRLRPIGKEIAKRAAEAGATVIDPLEYLCNSTACPVVDSDNKPIYHDMWNLRPSFVRERATFIDEIDSAAR